MGFFNKFSKKKEEPFAMPEEKKDPFQDTSNPYLNQGTADMNSGLHLNNLNNSSDFMNKYDSFGNKRPEDKFSTPRTQFGQEEQKTSNTSGNIEKDLQIVIAKLDAIKSEIAQIHHRMDLMEEKNKTPKYKW